MAVIFSASCNTVPDDDIRVSNAMGYCVISLRDSVMHPRAGDRASFHLSWSDARALAEWLRANIPA